MGHRNKINNKGAGKWLIKKKVVFALFEEGKTALSPEVKDFGLRSKRVTLPQGKLKGK